MGAIFGKEELENLKSLRRDLVGPVKSFMDEVHEDTIGDAKRFYAAQGRKARQNARRAQERAQEKMAAIRREQEEMKRRRAATMKRAAVTLALLALFSFAVVCAALSAHAAEEPGWQAAYMEILDTYRVQIAEDPAEYAVPELWYLVYDVDKDGTPELIVKTGTCEADYHGGLYTFRGGRAFQVGEDLGLGHSSIYSDPGENGIILMYGHMGWAAAVRISIQDGYAEELLYEDDLNARLQEDPDAAYVYPGDVIPGSVYLTLCRGELTLPLTHYREISQRLDGETPAAPGASYPKHDVTFYDKLMAGNGEVFAVTGDGFTNSPGRIGFRELMQKNVAADWMQGELRVLSASVSDLNGDGQLECVLAVSDGGREMRVVLSEQDGVVYAYLLNYTDGYELDSDGCFRPTRWYTARYCLIFDAEQAFLLTLPED